MSIFFWGFGVGIVAGYGIARISDLIATIKG
jgi:hypothetical protein